MLSYFADALGQLAVCNGAPYGHRFSHSDRNSLSTHGSLYRGLWPSERSTPMILNSSLLVVSAALLAYLVYALLRPEKF